MGIVHTDTLNLANYNNINSIMNKYYTLQKESDHRIIIEFKSLLLIIIDNVFVAKNKSIHVFRVKSTSMHDYVCTFYVQN